MNRTISLLIVSLIFLVSCKSTSQGTRQPEKNESLLVSMERTACYGRCPVYSIKVYQNGVLQYNAKQFTDTTGCFTAQLTPQQLTDLKLKFQNANFFKMADTYPEDNHTPTDLPSCILFFNNSGHQKTVTDKRWHTPETLTGLEKSVDSLIHLKVLQNCDK